MRFASVRRDGRETWGALIGADGFADLGARPGAAPTLRAAIEQGTLPDALPDATSPDCSVEEVEFLPVIGDPPQIFCVGLNYEKHRVETQRDVVEHPTIFVRLASSQQGHRGPLVKPAESSRFDYEGELAVVIGRGGRRIAADDVADHIVGYACYNDGSARDWQNHTSQWTPGKNFPATGAFGPYLVTPDEIEDLGAASLVTRVNGEERQRATIAQMTFPIPEIVAYLSTFTTLLPGTVICTGTPGGVGSRREPPTFLDDGDVVEVEIDGVGLLSNTVVAETLD